MTDQHTTADADNAPTAADALAIIKNTQAHTSALLTPNIAIFYALWGAIWLVIGVLFFLVQLGTIAIGTAGWATGALVLVGLVTSAVIGIRSGRGVSGPSSRQGLRYGLSWPLSMCALGTIVGAMADLGASPDLMAVITPALFVMLVGALYLVAGAMWNSTTDYVLGVWVLVVAVASVFVGLPGSPLVVGVGGGGGLLVVAGRWLVLRGRAR